MAKVLAISGAHRDSNTEKLLYELVRGCKNAGAKTTLIRIRNARISPCCGWSDCYYKNYCKVNDGMQKLYAAAEDADAWILASPTYFDNVSAYMKIFMDRMNPYCKPQRYKGKKVVLVAVGGASLRSIKKCLFAMKRFAKHMGLRAVDTIMAKADGEKEIYSNKRVLENVYKIGKSLGARLAGKPKH